MPLLAIDCDLRRIHAVDDAGTVVCFNADSLDAIKAWALAHKGERILFEIASPVDYLISGDQLVAYQKRRWMLYNIAMAQQLACWLGFTGGRELLVAPSSAWTNGFELKTRHAMAKCKQKQKDRRECECMIFMYRHAPGKWCSLPDYLASF